MSHKGRVAVPTALNVFRPALLSSAEVHFSKSLTYLMIILVQSVAHSPYDKTLQNLSSSPKSTLTSPNKSVIYFALIMISQAMNRFSRNLYLFSTKTNYFKLFDLPHNFTEQQLKATYLQLVKKHHPDLTKDPKSTEMFRDIQMGYQILSDPTKRRQHQLEHNSPGESTQQSVIDELLDKLYKNFQRKDPVNDEYNFSYKLFKQHYEKVEKPKGNYKRYEGQGGDEYFAHKEEKGESTWKFVAAGGAALGVVGLTFAFVNY